MTEKPLPLPVLRLKVKKVCLQKIGKGVRISELDILSSALKLEEENLRDFSLF